MTDKNQHAYGYRTILNKRIVILALTVAALGALYYVINSERYVIPETAAKALNIFLYSGIAVLAVNLILKLTETRFFKMFEGQLDIEERIFITKIYSFALYSIALTFILNHLGLSIQNLTIFLGLIATGLAFAVRDVLVSYLVWFIVLTKKPFRINDYIKIGEDSGIVDRIGTIFITLKPDHCDYDNIKKIPNKLLLDRTITSFGPMSKPVRLPFRLKNLPPDADKKISSCRKTLEKNLRDDESILITIENKDEYFFLVFCGRTSYEREQHIILLVWKTASAHFKKYLVTG